MGIPIVIPGLNEFVQEIEQGNLILVEGSIDPISSIFVQNLAMAAQQHEKDVRYITSRAKEEVAEQISLWSRKEVPFSIVEERSHGHWKDYICDNGVLVLDSFSYLIIIKTIHEVLDIVEEFLKLCKQKNAVVLLTMERGMIEEKTAITVSHLADGIFQFLSKDTQMGVARYIRIPKWMNGQSFDENIYYTFDGKRINVDLRARVR